MVMHDIYSTSNNTYFGQFADMVTGDNIGRSEYASSRVVQVSDKSFSGNDMIDWMRVKF